MKSNRRKFIQNLGVGAAGLTLGTTAMSLSSCATPVTKKNDEDVQLLFIGDNIALADTQYGKVKGYVLRGINYFLGIPYGADTSGTNRFMPPQKPQPWTDIFPAVWWGDSAPQNTANKYSNAYSSFVDHWNYSDVSENCLKINVLTPSLNDGGKRPVLVWLHGGGFTYGNGIEQDGYNGENLARLGDIVFCSLNHRLGPMGFTNLASIGGEKYAASGNVGMLDIVAALEWIRDNISNFGGDPGNVTIIGQSGGGRKVSTLTAMPLAKGLFHKAIVLSGSELKSADKEYSEKLALYVLKEAGLKLSEIDKLQQLPWHEYIVLANRAVEKLNKELSSVPGSLKSGFKPVVDGVYLPQHPFFPEASPTAAEVPMIICSVLNERITSRIDSSLESITLDGVKEELKGTFGDKTGEVVDTYAKVFPEMIPVEIWSMLNNTYRLNAVDQANAKSGQSANVYLAWFSWKPPLFDNRMRAFHTLDICFWFYNTNVMLTHTGGGARPRNLSAKMAGSLLQFMRTGDPNGGGLPQWPKYTSQNGETMILNDMSEVKNDPDREARKSLPI
jgi:para-nitrobenzyl esterase